MPILTPLITLIITLAKSIVLSIFSLCISLLLLKANSADFTEFNQADPNFSLNTYFTPSSPATNPKTNPSSIESIPLQEQVSILMRPMKQDYRIYDVFGTKEAALQVQAILNHKALIHNVWYQKGDKIGVFTIVRIDEQSVTLIDKKGATKTLSLNQTTP